VLFGLCWLVIIQQRLFRPTCTNSAPSLMTRTRRWSHTRSGGAVAEVVRTAVVGTAVVQRSCAGAVRTAVAQRSCGGAGRTAVVQWSCGGAGRTAVVQWLLVVAQQLSDAAITVASGTGPRAGITVVATGPTGRVRAGVTAQLAMSGCVEPLQLVDTTAGGTGAVR
jgi:hypothetical protein